MGILVQDYGVTKKGEQVRQYRLENASGMRAVLLDYGAVLAGLSVPDREGGLRDVVWGFADLAGYEENKPCFGAIVGRNANRIGGAEFQINGKTYRLAKNNGENNLHSGPDAYFRRSWKGSVTGENQVEFSLHSPDGDQGFPGNADLKVTYTLTDDNELQIAYWAKADQDTIFNLTNHSYFNLDGQESDSIRDQEVWLDADAFTPAKADLIPTGEIRSVEGTPLDFRAPKRLGEGLQLDCQDLKAAGGYDHNYVRKAAGYGFCGSLFSAKSGIRMEVSTDAPGIQLYTANTLQTAEHTKRGRSYGPHSAVCFEAQYFPDAVHHENFPSTLYRTGEIYQSRTAYRFCVGKRSAAPKNG